MQIKQGGKSENLRVARFRSQSQRGSSPRTLVLTTACINAIYITQEVKIVVDPSIDNVPHRTIYI